MYLLTHEAWLSPAQLGLILLIAGITFATLLDSFLMLTDSIRHYQLPWHPKPFFSEQQLRMLLRHRVIRRANAVTFDQRHYISSSDQLPWL